MQQTFVQMARTFYLDEMNDHLTYTILAEHTADRPLRQQIAHIAAMERRHASFWQEWLIAHRVPLPLARLHRGRLAALRLAQRLVNPLMLVGLLEFRETAGVKRYQHFLAHAPLEATDRKHLQAIVVDELEHETFFKHAAQAFGVAHVRDFVLGMNDGLVEILGTVAGLSAVYPTQPLLVAISGCIVGVAGALSMGLGAFTSVRSQRQVHNGARERMELLFTMAPERAIRAYHAELVDSGLPDPLAEELAHKLGTNKEALLQMVLQTSQDNEIRSGLLTGGAYLLGVLFPILPYFFVPSSLLALPLAIVSAGSTLMLMASLVALLSGLSIRQKAWEMVASGFAAAGISYAFGKLLQSLFLHEHS